MTKVDGKLILEDGSIFYGYSFGYQKAVSGEVVFNTGMVGYTEALTDPSYFGQLVVLTYPLIGNYGVSKKEEGFNNLDFESTHIQAKALIVSDYSNKYSHHHADFSIQEWLNNEKIPALYGIDTRELTIRLRDRGVMLGKIVFDENSDPELLDPNSTNLVAQVSCQQPTLYGGGSKKIILIDCGFKNNIIRNLLRFDTTVKVVPWNYDFTDEEYDGVLISNGPGDPEQCIDTINIIKKVINKNKPIFGICLGHQILALAAGAETYKLHFGHRSHNQPVFDAEHDRCYITSQNHGYAVNIDKIKNEWEEIFVNLNDETNEGIQHKSKPFFSVQFHPEGSSGPQDTDFLFTKFIKLVEKK